MLNGLEVGKVDSVKIVYEEARTKLQLRLWLEATVKVRENPVISIKTLGLMGEKYIQIHSVEGERFLAPESVVAGKPYFDMEEMIEQANGMITKLSNQVGSLVTTLNSTLETNKEGVTSIIKNLDSASKNLDEFSRDVKAHPWKLLIKGKGK